MLSIWSESMYKLLEEYSNIEEINVPILCLTNSKYRILKPYAEHYTADRIVPEMLLFLKQSLEVVEHHQLKP